MLRFLLFIILCINGKGVHGVWETVCADSDDFKSLLDRYVIYTNLSRPLFIY